MDAERAALEVIEAADPDGGTARPTEADYVRFEAWAVGRFGRGVWERYRRGGWDDGGSDCGGWDCNWNDGSDW